MTSRVSALSGPPPARNSSSSPASATKRLTQEVKQNSTEPNPALLHLGPTSDEDLFHWEAVLKGIRGSPYDGGLWLLTISIPPNYPLSPPDIRFVTPICHPNVKFETGEICLTLLSGEHWLPSYTLSSTLSAIQQLLTDPGLESPLNLDISNLYREDDQIGAEALVRYWTAEKRWGGEGKGFWVSERRVGAGGKMNEQSQSSMVPDIDMDQR